MLVALGFVDLLFVAGLGGVWLMPIGWFLTTAAAAEEHHARVTGRLGDVRVREVMSPDPATAPATIPVDRFVEEYVYPNRYSTFPLTDNGDTPVGLVTLKRVKRVRADRRASTAVRDVACAMDEIPVVSPDEPLAGVLPRMAGCSDGRALVMEGGRLVGLLSPTDVIRHLEVGDLRGRHEHQHI